MSKNKNMPAFPQPNIRDNPHVIGLSKREYFAGLALQGLLAGRWATNERVDCHPETIAAMALDHADELIKQLSTPQP